MTIARDICGTVFAGGSALLKARVEGANEVALLQSDLASITYTVEELDQHDANLNTVVEGHEDVALVVSAVIFNTLQTWDVDDTGCNFIHELDVSSDVAFATKGRHYLITYTLTPTSGQIIIVRFRVKAI